MLSPNESVDENSSTHVPTLDLHEIQATVLRQRPAPYFGTHVLLRVDDAQAGRQFLRRLASHIACRGELVERGQHLADGRGELCGPRGARASDGVAAKLSRGVPRAGMAARAPCPGDEGVNDPKNWDAQYAKGQIHIGVSAFSDSEEKRQRALTIARQQYEGFSGVSVVGMQDFGAQPGRPQFARLQRRHRPAGGRGQWCRAATRSGTADQGRASSSSDIRVRPGSRCRCRSRTYSVATEPMWAFANISRASARSIDSSTRMEAPRRNGN